MDVIEFVKTANRMCESTDECCDACPLRGNDDGFCIGDSVKATSLETLEEAISIAEKWAKEHPIKTRKSEFLKMFPNSRFQKSGEFSACPEPFDKTIDCLHTTDCKKCMRDFWNQEV